MVVSQMLRQCGLKILVWLVVLGQMVLHKLLLITVSGMLVWIMLLTMKTVMHILNLTSVNLVIITFSMLNVSTWSNASLIITLSRFIQQWIILVIICLHHSLIIHLTVHIQLNLPDLKLHQVVMSHLVMNVFWIGPLLVIHS